MRNNKNKALAKTLRLSAASLILLVSTGCTAAFLDTAAHDIFIGDETNFTEKNTAVADYLIQQAKAYIRLYDTIAAHPLGDTAQPGMDSAFGKMVPEQVGVRLAQLGYNVNLEDVAAASDKNYLRPSDAQKNKAPDFILSGTFTRHRTDMDVNMRITDARNNRIVAAFDYTLPLTRETADLAKPQPQIRRLPRK